jgi:hypothetical protein
MTIYKKYLFRWFLCIFLALLFIGMFNFIVDPYGFFRVLTITGFNQQKEGVRNKIRYVKALELPLRNPRTLIVGSSRVHDGMNPQHPLLQEYAPVYNLGLDMCRIKEARQFIEHALLHAEIKRILIGLDFFMFNAAEKVNNNGFDTQLIGRKVNIADYFFIPLLTKDAFLDSMRTLKVSNAQPERKEFLSNGFRPGNFVFYKVKNYAKLHYYTNWIFLSSIPQSTPYYAVFSLDEEVYKDFEEMLTICKHQKIDCRIYISPAHANLDGEGIRAAGLWESMENWKLRVTKMAASYNIPLWDFSGYNSVTTEPVDTPMKNYWDSSHFTEHTSDLILKRIYSDANSQTTIPADFGIRIFPFNIRSHLEQIRQNRDKYLRANLSSITILSKVYNKILAGAPLDEEETKDIFEVQ